MVAVWYHTESSAAPFLSHLGTEITIAAVVASETLPFDLKI